LIDTSNQKDMAPKEASGPGQFNLEERLAQTDRLLDNARTYLFWRGQLLDLTDEWLTISDYCIRFGIKNTQTVSNWMKRGIIPSEDIHDIPELNNTRFIRAKRYFGTE
jgi:hypothetical protein